MSKLDVRDTILPIMEESSRNLNEPGWLLELRRKVVDLFKIVPSDYSRHFKMDNVLEDWITDISERGLEDRFKCCPKGLLEEEKPEGIVVDVVNGRIVGFQLPREYRDKGIFATDLFVAIKKRENEVRASLVERVNRGLADKLEALNLSLFTNGIYIEIPAKLKLDAPIHIRRVFTDDFKMKFQTDIIRIGDLSEVTIYDEILKSGRENEERKVSVALDLYTGNSSKVIYNSSSIASNKLDITYHRNLVVENNSYLEANFSWLGGKTTISKVRNLMVGRGTTVYHNEIVFGASGETYYLNSHLHHLTDHTKGEITHRGIMKGKSKLVYNGLIKIDKNAPQADSFLSSHTILLDKEALAYDVPGLEIENNNVRATHSASVSPIDPEQVFYMRTRGLSEEEAKRLIVYGFLQPVLEKITDPNLKEKILGEIDKKWKL